MKIILLRLKNTAEDVINGVLYMLYKINKSYKDYNCYHQLIKKTLIIFSDTMIKLNNDTHR